MAQESQASVRLHKTVQTRIATAMPAEYPQGMQRPEDWGRTTPHRGTVQIQAIPRPRRPFYCGAQCPLRRARSESGPSCAWFSDSLYDSSYRALGRGLARAMAGVRLDTWPGSWWLGSRVGRQIGPGQQARENPKFRQTIVVSVAGCRNWTAQLDLRLHWKGSSARLLLLRFLQVLIEHNRMQLTWSTPVLKFGGGHW